MPIALKILNVDGVESLLELKMDKLYTIGRSRDSKHKINDSKCSRLHCQIRLTNDAIIIKDLGSKNGTYVNGYPISETYLYLGDKVTIGDARISIFSKGLTAIQRKTLTRAELVTMATHLDLSYQELQYDSSLKIAV